MDYNVFKEKTIEEIMFRVVEFLLYVSETHIGENSFSFIKESIVSNPEKLDEFSNKLYALASDIFDIANNIESNKIN